MEPPSATDVADGVTVMTAASASSVTVVCALDVTVRPSNVPPDWFVTETLSVSVP